MLLNNDLSTYIQSSHCNLKDEYQLLDGIYTASSIYKCLYKIRTCTAYSVNISLCINSLELVMDL
jgi:hypothetical protein